MWPMISGPVSSASAAAPVAAANDVQQRFADLYRFERDGAHLKVLAIGENQQADQTFALLRDLVLVVAQQRLAIGDPRTFLTSIEKP
jgi:hypothetical protein